MSISLCCTLLSDEDKIELAVINPAYVMGPVINGSQCVSMEVSLVFRQIIMGEGE